MSEKLTTAETKAGGLGILGFIDGPDAVAQLRTHYERELANAQQVLDEIDAGRVKVYHQRGPWAMKGRRCVWPEGESE